MNRYSLIVWFLLALCLGGLDLVIPEPTEADESKSSMDVRLDELAKQISGTLPEGKTSKLAFLDFTDLEGKVTNLGRFLVEELTARLSSSKGIVVVERVRIGSVLQEQKLNMAGVTSRDGSKVFGELIGADVLVSGTVSDLGSVLRINARLIRTNSGQVLASRTIDLASDRKTSLLLGKTVLVEPASLPDQSPVAKRYIGIWREKDGSEEYYYEIKTTGFVYYCELHDGEVFDLDTGIVQANMVTYSTGEPDNLITILEDSVRVSSLPDTCK